MSKTLDSIQLKNLRENLACTLSSYNITQSDSRADKSITENAELLESFLSAKKIEGCSDKTIKYYQATIQNLLNHLQISVRSITTSDLRIYLSEYQEQKQSSKVTIDNMRRIFSSFFAWLEDEDYIIKSPVRRIHRVRTDTLIKETISDEALELLRDSCTEIRDLALIDHLLQYIQQRTDSNPALFVSLSAPHTRLTISGIEVRLRNLGKHINLHKIHPHKFRRTLATQAIDKGMPIEQVQRLLGHVKIDTTLHYAMVNQSNVKMAHRKYLG